MKPILITTALFALVAVAPAATVGSLRCEHLVEPLGLDEAKPCLGWAMESETRGARQTAYRILVASKKSLLDDDKGDLWDSGKVESDESAHVAYGGPALKSNQLCYWKVRIWDESGKQSSWSKTASWSMGLLEAADWQAKWIGAEEPSRTPAQRPAVTIKKATYAATDGAGAADVTAKLAAELAQNGGFALVVGNGPLGGDPAFNHVKRLRVEYEVGGQAKVVEAGEGETVVVPEGYTPPGTPKSLRYLRKSFTLDKAVARATLYATAQGLYEASLNGKRVGDITLAPEFTQFEKRLRYQTYDVTAMVRKGANVLGAQIANGWFAGHIGNGGFQVWGQRPALRAQLEIEFADGTTTRVVTDGTWKSHDSPLLYSDFMKGENFDARAILAGWNTPNVDDAKWDGVSEPKAAAVPIQAQVTQPVRKLAEIKPVKLTEPKPKQWTFDLAQNMVGVVRLKVNEPAGTKITLRHAEMLSPDGTLYTTNLRGAPSVDTYICKGGGETWQPQFTFHGFRYVELTGLTRKPTVESVTGVVLGSDTPRTGEFSCSDKRINRLQANIEWGQRGNYLSIPTDCPQRDERLGWMGDAQVFVRTATFNADVEAFFTKWLVDVDDSQGESGAFSDVSPKAKFGSPGTPAWADAGVICPWTIYQAYGDKRLLERHFPAMVKWVEWCRTHSNGLIRERDRGNDYGDWLSIGADTPKDVIGTAYFAYSTRLVARAARALGKESEAAQYEKLFNDIREAFQKKYVAADGRIHGNTQCVYVMGLKFDLLTPAQRDQAIRYLVDDIVKKGNHLSTGFVGVSYLLPVLAENGQTDLAYKLLFQDTFPSWLFSVKHGATTIWERWDGWTPDKGFQDPGMNSFNHYSLGSCGEWFYSGIAGIFTDPAAPGFKRFTVKPTPGPGLTSAKASFRSIHGLIASEWKVAGGQIGLTVTVPPNTTATIVVPTRDPASVKESGKPAASATGLKPAKAGTGEAAFEVGSGTYRFTAAAP